jgi:hypothetical protein
LARKRSAMRGRAHIEDQRIGCRASRRDCRDDERWNAAQIDDQPDGHDDAGAAAAWALAAAALAAALAVRHVRLHVGPTAHSYPSIVAVP